MLMIRRPIEQSLLAMKLFMSYGRHSSRISMLFETKKHSSRMCTDHSSGHHSVGSLLPQDTIPPNTLPPDILPLDTLPLDTLTPRYPTPQKRPSTRDVHYPPWEGPAAGDTLPPPYEQTDACENITFPCSR